MSEGDPHHPEQEPDLDDVEYEALDEIADKSRESRPQWSVTVEALKAASDVVAQFDMKDLVSRAERICLDGVGAARDVFADMTPNDTHGTLQQSARQAASALGTIGRRRARAQFLALRLGFVAVNHHGPTGDSVLGLVSKALEGLGTSADGIEDLARAWSAGERSFFDRMHSTTPASARRAPTWPSTSSTCRSRRTCGRTMQSGPGFGKTAARWSSSPRN